MKILLLFVFVIFMNINSVLAQDNGISIFQRQTINGERPKIGLVLSGGGAKGMAHVGVLKVLDSLGIKPDYITGTSMGSIVGGLYAIGYSTDMLEQMIKTTDWSKYLSNNSEYRGINMIEKEDYKNYYEFPFHNWLPGLPQGAIKGQELELLFNELTVSVARDTAFDEFSIPYRAVAVDILTGKPYVFSSGSLATAMRSSMSIPSVMDPVKYKGMLLVDGGLVDNFPVKVCKDMGADIIIGVYTGAELMPEEKLNSMVNILKQSSFVASIKNARESRKLVDIYIEPHLTDMNAADFTIGMKTVERGYKAAMANIDRLVALKNYLGDYYESDTVLMKDSVFIADHNVVFDNDDHSLAPIIVKNYGHIDGELVAPNQIAESIHYLYGTRLFNKLTYDYSPAEIDSGVRINYNVVNADDKMLLLSLNYSTENKAGINIGFRYRNLLIPGSKIELKLRLSENPGVKVQVFSYLRKNIKHGIMANYYYKTSKIPFYSEKSLIGEYSSHFHRWSLGYHYFSNSRSDLYAGISHERAYYTRIIDLSSFSFPKIVNLSTYLNFYFQHNNLDEKYFASRGAKWKIDAKIYLNNSSRYYMPQDTLDKYPDMPEFLADTTIGDIKISFDHQSYIPISKKVVFTNEFNVFVGTGYLYSTWIGGVNSEEEYQVPFWGLSENAIMASNGMTYRTGLRYEFIKKFYISGKANIGFIAEDVFDLMDEADDIEGKYSSIYNLDNYIVGGGIKLSYNSILGPISVTVTKSTLSSGLWWHFLMGYSF